METCDEIANMLTKCGCLDGGRGQGAYLYMTDLALGVRPKDSDHNKANSLLFRVFERNACLDFFPVSTCTHLFNQVTDDCIVEILYCCPLNTLQSECDIYFLHTLFQTKLSKF